MDDVHETLKDMIFKTSKGNPGAIQILISYATIYESIDPDSVWKSATPFVQFDECRIDGEGVYYLFNDKCNRDFRLVTVLLRAVQLGFLDSDRLREVAFDSTRQINFTDDEFSEFSDKVCNALPNFQRAK